MAKYKAAGKGSSKSKTPASQGGLIPCAIVLLIVFGAVFALFYFSLASN
jgi:hypothetical protein